MIEVWKEVTEVETPRCCFCGERSKIWVDLSAYSAWQSGTLLQDAFPNVSPSERELLKMGTHPACWDAMFGDPDDDDEDEEDE